MNEIGVDDSLVRLFIFAFVLFVMMAWEYSAPVRPLSAPRGIRWLSNLSLSAMNAILGVLFGLAGFGAAALSYHASWGLFNWLSLPYWVEFAGALVLLDLVIYWQHRFFHWQPALWRVHRVHHADVDIDATTGLRFHPLEAAVSMMIKLVAVGLLGPPVVAVIVFEIVLNASSIFTHSNVRIPKQFEQMLRLVLVTPDMHRVHHSVRVAEQNKNFGFNLSCWDRLFGCFQNQPIDGHRQMSIGLDLFRSVKDMSLWAVLLQPFTRKPKEDATK